ncbi:MAG: hypothetical protein FGM43_04895 [Sinobacteraceae bacterium]|nr:hypothetical protein [Nevskiaceae bacterium]
MTTANHPRAACLAARGQALIETLLVAMLAVPMLLGILFLFELQAAQQATLATTRQALFHYHYARGTATADEIAARARSEHLDTLFVSQLGSVSGQQVSLSATTQSPSVQRVEDAAFTLLEPALGVGAGSFDLARGSAMRASASIEVTSPSILRLALDEPRISLSESLSALHDDWFANSREVAVSRIAGLAVTGRLREWTEPMQAVNGAIALLEPAFAGLCIGRIDIDVVPEDRVYGATPTDLRSRPC